MPAPPPSTLTPFIPAITPTLLLLFLTSWYLHSLITRQRTRTAHLNRDIKLIHQTIASLLAQPDNPPAPNTHLNTPQFHISHPTTHTSQQDNNGHGAAALWEWDVLQRSADVVCPDCLPGYQFRNPTRRLGDGGLRCDGSLGDRERRDGGPEAGLGGLHRWGLAPMEGVGVGRLDTLGCSTAGEEGCRVESGCGAVGLRRGVGVGEAGVGRGRGDLPVVGSEGECEGDEYRPDSEFVERFLADEGVLRELGEEGAGWEDGGCGEEVGGLSGKHTAEGLRSKYARAGDEVFAYFGPEDDKPGGDEDNEAESVAAKLGVELIRGERWVVKDGVPLMPLLDQDFIAGAGDGDLAFGVLDARQIREGFSQRRRDGEGKGGKALRHVLGDGGPHESHEDATQEEEDGRKARPLDKGKGRADERANPYHRLGEHALEDEDEQNLQSSRKLPVGVQPCSPQAQFATMMTESLNQRRASENQAHIETGSSRIRHKKNKKEEVDGIWEYRVPMERGRYPPVPRRSGLAWRSQESSNTYVPRHSEARLHPYNFQGHRGYENREGFPRSADQRFHVGLEPNQSRHLFHPCQQLPAAEHSNLNPLPPVAPYHVHYVHTDYRQQPKIGDRQSQWTRYGNMHHWDPPSNFHQDAPDFGLEWQQTSHYPSKHLGRESTYTKETQDSAYADNIPHLTPNISVMNESPEPASHCHPPTPDISYQKIQDTFGSPTFKTVDRDNVSSTPSPCPNTNSNSPNPQTPSPSTELHQRRTYAHSPYPHPEFPLRGGGTESYKLTGTKPEIKLDKKTKTQRQLHSHSKPHISTHSPSQAEPKFMDSIPKPNPASNPGSGKLHPATTKEHSSTHPGSCLAPPKINVQMQSHSPSFLSNMHCGGTGIHISGCETPMQKPDTSGYAEALYRTRTICKEANNAWMGAPRHRVHRYVRQGTLMDGGAADNGTKHVTQTMYPVMNGMGRVVAQRNCGVSLNDRVA